ncbi:MAG: hypothetical protein ACI9V1_000750 [Spirosomataceae bacterium]|jgi:hypothetical protein
MTYKWDAQVAEKYAKELATKICEENYNDADSLDGDQILEATSVRQVNFLIIRSLYNRWQEETRRLQSPYFDFAHPEVQDALSEFMNILSQFIAVRQKEFEPLLVGAIMDTLQLGMKPSEYFSKILRDLPNFRLSGQWVDRNRNYFKINTWVFDELKKIAAENPSMYANEVIELIHAKLKERDTDSIEEVLTAFSEIVAIPSGFTEPEKVEVVEVENKPSKSFFDSIVEEKLISRIRETSANQPAERRSIVEPEPQAIKLEIAKPLVVEPPTAVVSVTEEIKETVVMPSRAVPTIEVEKLETRSVNEKHVIVTQSLNDKATTTGMMTDYHRLSKVDSIRKSVSLNQRYLFTKHLFGGNVDAYNKSIDELDQLYSFEDAQNLVIREYVPQYLWNVKSVEVEEFFEILRRRFS